MKNLKIMYMLISYKTSRIVDKKHDNYLQLWPEGKVGTAGSVMYWF